MVNKILVDTNVLLDYLLEREPFFEDAKKVILSCIDGNVKGGNVKYFVSQVIKNSFLVRIRI